MKVERTIAEKLVGDLKEKKDEFLKAWSAAVDACPVEDGEFLANLRTRMSLSYPIEHAVYCIEKDLLGDEDGRSNKDL